MTDTQWMFMAVILLLLVGFLGVVLYDELRQAWLRSRGGDGMT